MRLVPVLTVGVLLAGGMEPQLIWQALLGTEELCPLKVMVVFYGMAYLCLSVNETGLLRHVALRIASRTRSERQAFLAVAAVTGALTLLTSNDVVILTLTPVIIHLCRRNGYDPLPLLYLEFVTANVWSISLLVGNPTNVIAAGAAGLSFGRYMKLLAVPGIVGGISAVIVTRLHFRSRCCAGSLCSRSGRGPLDLSSEPQDRRNAEEAAVEPGSTAANDIACEDDGDGSSAIVRWPRARVAAGRLAALLLFAALDDIHGVELWASVAVATVLSIASDLVMDFLAVGGTRVAARATLVALPWEVLAFALVLFVVVEALQAAGLVGLLAQGLARCARHGPASAAFSLGASSILACQLLNNQPMTVLFSKVLAHPSFDTSSSERLTAFGAVIIGSNVGANLTLIGALAGPMWVRVAAKEGVRLSGWDFTRTMLCITPSVALASLSVLTVEAWLLVAA